MGELWSVKANLTSVKMGNHQREGQKEQHGSSENMRSEVTFRMNNVSAFMMIK